MFAGGRERVNWKKNWLSTFEVISVHILNQILRNAKSILGPIYSNLLKFHKKTFAQISQKNFIIDVR